MILLQQKLSKVVDSLDYKKDLLLGALVLQYLFVKKKKKPTCPPAPATLNSSLHPEG